MSLQNPPWWERLPEDFYRQADGTELDKRHPWLVHGTASVDHVLRFGLGSAIGLSLTPTLLRHREREVERLRFYAKAAERGRAETVFAPPLKGLLVRERRLPESEGIPRSLLRFQSPFVPLHPELVSSYTSFSRNGLAEAEYWSHPSGPRRTLIFLHGFLAHPYAFNARMFHLRWFWKNGWDILLAKLPFHGRRAALTDPFPGYGWFAHGIAHCNEAMLHAVHDVRAWIDHLQDARGVTQVGVSGLSLGGYLSALTAVADDRLAFCIPNSPVVTAIDMLRDWQPTRSLLGVALETGMFTLQGLRHATAVHSPLTYRPRIDPSRVLVIGGAGDRFTSPRFVRLLHDEWPGSRLRWFPGNHMIHLGQRHYLKAMRRHMELCTAMETA